MTDAEIARPLELELQKLFGEDSYHLERRPCTGKYRGHTDYTLVFGSGRRLYIGLNQRNYLNSLHDHLRAIRYFREHQKENTQRITNLLKAHNTPFCHGEAEIMPYDGTSSAAHDRMLALLADAGELEYERLKAAFKQQESVFAEDCYRVEQYDAWLTDHSTCDWMWNIQIVRIYSPLRIVFGHD